MYVIVSVLPVCMHVIMKNFIVIIFVLADAYLIECNSLQGVHLLISRICECLSLWKLICEHQFELVTESVDKVLYIIGG